MFPLFVQINKKMISILQEKKSCEGRRLDPCRHCWMLICRRGRTTDGCRRLVFSESQHESRWCGSKKRNCSASQIKHTFTDLSGFCPQKIPFKHLTFHFINSGKAEMCEKQHKRRWKIIMSENKKIELDLLKKRN